MDKGNKEENHRFGGPPTWTLRYKRSEPVQFRVPDFHHPGGSSLYAAYHFHVVSPQVTAMVCYFLLRTKRTRQATSNVQSHSTLYILLCPRWAFGKGNYQKARGQVVLNKTGWQVDMFSLSPPPSGWETKRKDVTQFDDRALEVLRRTRKAHHRHQPSRGVPFSGVGPPKMAGCFCFRWFPSKKTTRNRGTNCFNTHG